MKDLEEILKDFKGVCQCNENEAFRVNKLTEEFGKIAKRIFYEGHFETENNTRIYPNDIEFYYHEDRDGGLKDPIMYHTNDRLVDDKLKKFFDDDYPYFKKCALHFHTSGIDVTFEEEGKYRASFLIRGYTVKKDKKEIVETRSTFIYDYVFSRGFVNDTKVLIWKKEDVCKVPDETLKSSPRVHVYKYKKDDKGNYLKDNKNRFIPEETPCDRRWRFQKNKFEDTK